MNATNTETLHAKLQDLRTELVDLAFRLECLGQITAAEVAISTSSRIHELCQEMGRESVQIAV